MVQSRLLFRVHCRMSIAVPNILIRSPILIAMLVQKSRIMMWRLLAGMTVMQKKISREI